ncbi:MAG: DUF418 domain-containing protein [Ginsengibacter sp.]
MNTAQPILQNNRTVIVDIIRGFALLGVLIANLAGFINFALPDYQVALLTNTVPDKITEYFVSLFIDGKFIMIFSILFGYGFGVLIERVAKKGMNTNRFFIRRMIILLLFALLHLAIWWGEILNVYAMAGLLMLLFKNVKTKKILFWGLFFLFIVTPIIQGLKIFLLPPPGEKLNALLNDYVTGIRSGNLFNIAKSNYTVTMYFFVERWSQLRDVAEALGKFLIGYYIYKSGYLQNLSASIAFIKQVFRIALVISILYLVKKVIIEIIGVTYEGKMLTLIDYELSNTGILSLSLVYCTSLVQIYYRNNNLKIYKALAAVGMMSLTNYVSQTIIYIFFFYGFGLSMLGKMHMQWVLPMAVVIFTIQIFISRSWMERFQFGPAEWIWRQLTYWKKLPLRK